MIAEEKIKSVSELLSGCPDLGYTYREIADHLGTDVKDARNVVRQMRGTVIKKVMKSSTHWDELITVVFWK